MSKEDHSNILRILIDEAKKNGAGNMASLYASDALMRGAPLAENYVPQISTGQVDGQIQAEIDGAADVIDAPDANDLPHR